MKTKIKRIEQYDVVFVGLSDLGHAVPPPMKSVLREYSLRGKTVIPFNSNAGYGVGSSFETVRALCPQSIVLEGFSSRGGIERDGVRGRRKRNEKQPLSFAAPPMIKLSRDGTLGWDRSVEAKGEERNDERTEPLEFASAWIELLRTPWGSLQTNESRAHRPFTAPNRPLADS